jgi:hypothetical protein
VSSLLRNLGGFDVESFEGVDVLGENQFTNEASYRTDDLVAAAIEMYWTDCDLGLNPEKKPKNIFQ